MLYVQIAVLALIQGAAELLPVSSSAHVIVAEKLMGMDPSTPDMIFLLIMLHTGTMFAVLAFFWPRWRTLLAARTTDGGDGGPTGRRFVSLVVIATGITGVLALGLKALIESVIIVRVLHYDRAEVEQLAGDLRLVSAALFAVGVLIIAAGKARVKERPDALTWRSATWIAIVQALCLPFRGFSRSGATISTALFRGVPRALAEDFSFALAVALTPAVIVYGAYKLVKWHAEHGHFDIVPFLIPGLVGMVFSFIAGLIALRFLSRVLEHGGWKYFGYYCIAASAVVMGVALAGY